MLRVFGIQLLVRVGAHLQLEGLGASCQEKDYVRKMSFS